MLGVEGFWIVQYEGVRGAGGGVVTIMNGHLYGGDSGYTYVGTYSLDGSAFSARVAIKNFLPGVPNLLGIDENFDLSISGQLIGDEIRAVANPIGFGVVGLALRLSRYASF